MTSEGTLLGFAIVDRRSASDATALWLTSRDNVRVLHTNAVVIAHDDEHHDAKLRALTADRSVVLTHATKSPIEFAHALSVQDFQVLADETAAHQQRILDAISDYMLRTRNRNLVVPEFPASPELGATKSDEPAFRALSVADYVANVWMAWLVSDEQRVRRTSDPRTGASPWMMPGELAEPALKLFPPQFAERMKPEPLS